MNHDSEITIMTILIIVMACFCVALDLYNRHVALTWRNLYYKEKEAFDKSQKLVQDMLHYIHDRPKLEKEVETLIVLGEAASKRARYKS